MRIKPLACLLNFQNVHSIVHTLVLMLKLRYSGGRGIFSGERTFHCGRSHNWFSLGLLSAASGLSVFS